MPACAGMTERRRLFAMHIIPSPVFSQEDTKVSDNIILNFVLFVPSW
jgi:hypothetical protein